MLTRKAINLNLYFLSPLFYTTLFLLSQFLSSLSSLPLSYNIPSSSPLSLPPALLSSPLFSSLLPHVPASLSPPISLSSQQTLVRHDQAKGSEGGEKDERNKTSKGIIRKGKGEMRGGRIVVEGNNGQNKIQRKIKRETGGGSQRLLRTWVKIWTFGLSEMNSC